MTTSFSPMCLPPSFDTERDNPIPDCGVIIAPTSGNMTGV